MIIFLFFSPALGFFPPSSQDKQETYAPVGTNIRLDCCVKGYPQPNITWFKDDKPIQKSSFRYFNSVFSLNLRFETQIPGLELKIIKLFKLFLPFGESFIILAYIKILL